MLFDTHSLLVLELSVPAAVTHPDWLLVGSGATHPLIHMDRQRAERGYFHHEETNRPIYYSCRNRKASTEPLN